MKLTQSAFKLLMTCLGSRTTCAGKWVLALILLLVVPASAKTSILLRSEASVKAQTITLGDVAQIKASAAEAKKLASINLGISPLPGKTRSIDLGTIKLRFRQQKIDLSAISPESANQCLVTRAFQVLDGNQLIQIAHQYLEAHLESGEGKLVIEPQAVPREVILPEGNLELTPELRGSSIGAIRRVGVSVTVDGKPYGNPEVIFQVRRYIKVAIAQSTIPQGRPLDPSLIQYEERDRMNLPEDVVREGESLDRLQTTQTISKGNPITHRQIAEPAVVHRGDLVTIYVRTGAIEVAAQGVASEDGRLNQAIRVRNTSSNQEFRAKVIDAGTVEIRF